jgi:hypothetical protein
MAYLGREWRTSSVSQAGNCVGLRELPEGAVAVCNTNDPDVGWLALARPAAATWIAACKAGELDDLT